MHPDNLLGGCGQDVAFNEDRGVASGGDGGGTSAKAKGGPFGRRVSPWPRALEYATLSVVVAARLQVLQSPRRAGRGPESTRVV